LRTLRRRFAEIIPPFTRDIPSYLKINTSLFAWGREEAAANVIAHGKRQCTLLNALSTSTFLCIEMVLTRLACDKLACFCDANALGV
jgi:hypothetical protein